MEPSFTWVATYKEITRWIASKEEEQADLISTLKEVGVEGFKDVNEDGENFELHEIDPFSFFAYLNKYKTDSKRVEILKSLHSKLGLSCEVPQDVKGIPTAHPLKVRLFPFKYLRVNNELATLWMLFRHAIRREIDNTLFQKALSIQNVGKGKLTISLFYVDPEYYLPLDSKTVAFLRKRKLKYSFDTVETYAAISKEAKLRIVSEPYKISYSAWEELLKEKEGLFIDEKHKKIGSVRTLLDILDELNEEGYDEPVSVFYRGHSSVTFELKPSIYRTKRLINREDSLFKDIIARTPLDFKDCNTTFEKLVKMQHYSLPTRLLDITSNPLVALFFACKDESQKHDDGKLYRFEIKESEIKYFDSDTVSVVANISRRPIGFTIDKIRGVDKKEFNCDDIILYLLHEIRSEKPHFSPVIDPSHIEMVFCVKPKLDNPRIIRQEGAFFIFGINGDKSQPAVFDFEHKAYVVDKSLKEKILKQLDVLGINESTLFPEIEHVAKHLKEKY